MNDCPFCNIDRKVLASSDLCLAIYDKYPVNAGHILVIPRRHVGDYFSLAADEVEDIWRLVREVKEFIDLEFQPSGFNVGFNVGPVAGQTVDHVHIHVIPRYAGDMDDPTGGVRHVIPEKGKYNLGTNKNKRGSFLENNKQKRIRERSAKKMDNIVISPTYKTPEIILNSNGNMLIKGRSIPEDTSSFYDRLLDWIIQYCINPEDKTSITIMLEYVNDGSMKYLLQMLRELSVLRNSGRELEINWYYETVDSHMKELGGNFSNCIDAPINLIPIDKI